MGFSDEFDHVIEQMEASGKRYAKKKAESWFSQQLTGSVLSSIIARQDKGLSDKKSEYAAKDSEDYRNHLRETADKIREELEEKAVYEAWSNRFEKLRSTCSLEKKMLSG